MSHRKNAKSQNTHLLNDAKRTHKLASHARQRMSSTKIGDMIDVYSASGNHLYQKMAVITGISGTTVTVRPSKFYERIVFRIKWWWIKQRIKWS